MSLAWMSAVVLRREPWRAVAVRLAARILVPAAWLWLSGVPGTAWTGAIPWSALRALAFVFAVVSVGLYLLLIANVFVNRRVLLVMMPTGALERPRALQRRVFQAAREFVIGSRIAVTTEPPRGIGRSGPWVTLAAEGTVRRIPLYGTPVATFIAETNTLLQGRGVTLVFADAPATDGTPGRKGP